MTQQVMSQYEGAAWRVQLDCMIRAIEPNEQAAIEAQDDATITLLGHLRLAREAAVSIETRPPLELKGVRLERN